MVPLTGATAQDTSPPGAARIMGIGSPPEREWTIEKIGFFPAPMEANAHNRRRANRALMLPAFHPHQERSMSDQSDDFRQADGRFGKGNPGGPGRPRAAQRVAALDLRAAEAGPD